MMNDELIIKHLEENNNTKVGVLDKIVSILSCVAENNYNLQEIITETKISRSTVHRLLLALEQHHFVVRTSNGYSIGSRLIGWSESSKLTTIIQMTKPLLIKLRDLTGESTQLYVREGNNRVCLISVEPNAGLKNTVPVGAIYPLEVGSAGKVISVWDGLEMDSAKKEKILKQGWAESIAEREEGVASVSAPILKNGSLLGVISISGPISRLGLEPGKLLSDTLVKTSKEIELLLK